MSKRVEVEGAGRERAVRGERCRKDSMFYPQRRAQPKSGRIQEAVVSRGEQRSAEVRLGEAGLGLGVGEGLGLGPGPSCSPVDGTVHISGASPVLAAVLVLGEEEAMRG